MLRPMGERAPAEDPPLNPAQLDAFALFEGVADEPRRAMLASAEHRELSVGELLLREAHANDRMYLVLQGELGVFLHGTGGEPVARVGPGEAVGSWTGRRPARASSPRPPARCCRSMSRRSGP